MSNYSSFTQRLSRLVSARFSEIEAIYNFEFGNEMEVALCQIISSVLPDKFGVCRGFVINQKGNRAGDDIIIYDRMNFPLIRKSISTDFLLKHQVPVEAVYSYIECKSSINTQEVLNKAFDQVRNVKKLLLTRCLLPNPKYEKNGPIYNNRPRDWPRQEPKFCNQPYTVIFTRKWNSKLVIDETNDECTPDLLVLGKNEIASQSVNLGPDGIKGALFIDYDHFANLKIENVNGDSFGISLIMLLQALNKIELLPINWLSILNYEFSLIKK